MVNGYYKTVHGPGNIPSTMSMIGEPLVFPTKGKYVISAKVYVFQGSADYDKVDAAQITARLEAFDGDTLENFDVSVATVYPAQKDPFNCSAATLALLVIADLKGPGRVEMKLDKQPSSMPYLQWGWLKITAIQVDAIIK